MAKKKTAKKKAAKSSKPISKVKSSPPAKVISKNESSPPAKPISQDIAEEKAAELAALISKAGKMSDQEKTAQVFKWIIEGSNDFDLLDACRTYWPKDKPEPIIEQAIKLITGSGFAPKTVIRGFCFESYKDLYFKMRLIGDYANAARVLKDISALFKDAPELEPPTKKEK